MRLAVLALSLALLLPASLHATDLIPEMKGYDFGEAYYIEDGGVVIAHYSYGFYCPDGIKTPEGIRVMPGMSFMQFDASRMIVDKYKLLHFNKEGTRAYFHQETYRYKVVKDEKGKYHDIIEPKLLNSETFYLTKNRLLEWFDFGIPYVDIHPGAQGWRTRPQY